MLSLLTIGLYVYPTLWLSILLAALLGQHKHLHKFEHDYRQKQQQKIKKITAIPPKILESMIANFLFIFY